MIIPDIEVKIDKESDIKLFNRFLNHPNFPQNRKLVLRAFPDLKDLLDKNDDEAKTVETFVSYFYKENIGKIKKIVNRSRSIIKNHGKESLKVLGKIMDYKWEKELTYEAKPTILPFSPYKNNTFYFSILSQIKNKDTDKNILEIALHEISHFILFDQLKKEIDHSLNRDAGHYLKESIAAAILNKSEFSFPKREGNPEIRYINISFQNKKHKLVDFVSEQINKKGYKEALKFLVSLFEKNKERFSEKMKLWNKYGKDITKKEDVFEKYKEFINLE